MLGQTRGVAAFNESSNLNQRTPGGFGAGRTLVHASIVRSARKRAHGLETGLAYV